MLDYYDDDCFFQRHGKRLTVMNRHFIDYRNPKVREYMSQTIARMVEDYLKLLAGEGEPALALTTISQSVESHLVALAAEESRLAHGKVIDL